MFEDAAEAIHRLATPEVWHRGLMLARDGAVRVVVPGPISWLFAVGLERETRVTRLWTRWHCECLSIVRPCAHIAAAAYALSFVGVLLEAMPDLLRMQPRTTVRLRSEGLDLFLRVVEAVAKVTGEVHETLVAGDSRSPNSIVAAIPDGSTEVRIWPDNVDKIFAALADAADVTFDGRPIRVAPTALRVGWLSFPSTPGIKIPLIPPGEAKTFYYPDVLLRGDTLHRLEYDSRSWDEVWGFSVVSMLENSEQLSKSVHPWSSQASSPGSSSSCPGSRNCRGCRCNPDPFRRVEPTVLSRRQPPVAALLASHSPPRRRRSHRRAHGSRHRRRRRSRRSGSPTASAERWSSRPWTAMAGRS